MSLEHALLCHNKNNSHLNGSFNEQVATPVQLLALDIYNRPLRKLSLGEVVTERLRFQTNNFASIVGARISRIFPAYGIGGIGNTYLRDKWRDQLLRKGKNMH
jgi:hypothetical protein